MSLGDSSKRNYHGDFIEESPNDEHLREVMRRVEYNTSWFIVVALTLLTIFDVTVTSHRLPIMVLPIYYTCHLYQFLLTTSYISNTYNAIIILKLTNNWIWSENRLNWGLPMTSRPFVEIKFHIKLFISLNSSIVKIKQRHKFCRYWEWLYYNCN